MTHSAAYIYIANKRNNKHVVLIHAEVFFIRFLLSSSPSLSSSSSLLIYVFYWPLFHSLFGSPYLALSMVPCSIRAMAHLSPNDLQCEWIAWLIWSPALQHTVSCKYIMCFDSKTCLMLHISYRHAHWLHFSHTLASFSLSLSLHFYVYLNLDLLIISHRHTLHTTFCFSYHF